ncbi:MAG: hypothetical protein J6D87_06385 [Clostridia bacterium]|nr:hypothetical protein [Clostridia bacterium]
MKRTLIDLWYGNIDPQEQAQANPQVPDLLKLLERNHDALNKTLNDDQKEILEKYQSCADEISGFCERDSFIYGFRLGMRLAIEALTDEDDNDL